MGRNIKHARLLLIAVLVVGGCTISPLVISAMQNDHLLDQVKTSLIKPINIEQKQLSIVEKMALYYNYGRESNSVTMSSQWRNNTSLESRKDVEKAVRAELAILFPMLGCPEIAKFAETMHMDNCTPLTFVDRDEPSQYVILWSIDMRSEAANLSLFMDDETHKIYMIGFEQFDRYSDEPMDPAVAGASLREAATGFGKYLDLPFEVDYDKYAAYLHLHDNQLKKSISMMLEYLNDSYLSIGISYDAFDEIIKEN